MNNNSLVHTKWNYKYHIVFAPKSQKTSDIQENKKDIDKILRSLCEYKGVEIIETNACKDHIHILVSILPKLSVSNFMSYLNLMLYLISI